MDGAASQMHLARTDLNEEQNIDRFQPHRFHREEIAGQQLVLVLT